MPAERLDFFLVKGDGIGSWFAGGQIPQLDGEVGGTGSQHVTKMTIPRHRQHGVSVTV